MYYVDLVHDVIFFFVKVSSFMLCSHLSVIHYERHDGLFAADSGTLLAFQSCESICSGKICSAWMRFS